MNYQGLIQNFLYVGTTVTPFTLVRNGNLACSDWWLAPYCSKIWTLTTVIFAETNLRVSFSLVSLDEGCGVRIVRGAAGVFVKGRWVSSAVDTATAAAAGESWLTGLFHNI